jgi:hypothetical protein
MFLLPPQQLGTESSDLAFGQTPKREKYQHVSRLAWLLPLNIGKIGKT